MPLLGTKAFILKTASDGYAGTSSCGASSATKRGKFFLQLTNETFDSREDLDERIKFYNRKIWSCRCTGHPNLSFEEAQRNESRILESLSRTFPSVFEAAVLNFVHLSKSPLPPLIDAVCKMISEKLFIGEPIEFKVKKNAVIVRGKICHPSGSTCVGGDPNCVNFHQYVPDKLMISSSSRYTVKLDSENKLVCNIPGADLIRLTHVPSKENIRVFIRCHAVRFGVRPESPWVVDADARRRVGIPDMAYPAEIEAAIRSHTVYSKNMRLCSTTKTSNDRTQSTLAMNGNSVQLISQSVTKPKLQSKLQNHVNGTTESSKENSTPKISSDDLHPSLVRVIKELQDSTGIQTTQSKYFIAKLTRELRPDQVEALPENIRKRVNERLQMIEEKRMIATLSVEEKRSYVSDKIRKKMLELRLENQTYEDTEFSRDFPIPEPEPFLLPDSVPNEFIGDIFFICEFFDCFSPMLNLDDKLSLNFETVCQWLTTSESSTRLAELITPLVRILLIDDIFKDITLYNIKLPRIPICTFSAPEFARICLKIGRLDEDDVYKDSEIIELVQLLTVKDFHELSTKQQFRVLFALCHLLLDTNSVVEQINKYNEDIKRLREQLATLINEQSVFGQNGTRNADCKEDNENHKTIMENIKESEEPKRHTILDDFVIKEDDSKTTSEKLTQSRLRQDQILQEKLKKMKTNQDTEELRRQVAIEKVENKIARKRMMLTKMTRFAALGSDADFNKYWWFSSYKGVVVEKPCKVDKNFVERPSKWYYYNSVDQLDELMKSLLSKGIRESRLLSSLKKHYTELSCMLSSSCHMDDKSEESDQSKLLNRGDIQCIGTACVENILLLEQGIFKASLANLDRDEFQSSIQNANGIKDITAALATLQSSILKRFGKGMFKNYGRPAENDDVTKYEKEWIDDLVSCKTFTHLYFMTEILDSSLSITDTRCKICKRVKEEVLILCDGCNSAFHLYCLRPPLYEIPEGDWLCRTCNTDKSNEHLSVKSKFQCTICKECERNEDTLARCRQCFCHVHLACHSPPIRSTKRSDWICWKCRRPRRGGGTYTSGTRSSSTSSNRKRSWDGSDDDSGNESTF
ncbi:hypothetical protein GJ496_003023 [Pomphorhynchus laevis]|nr:hypothetical protein GJ496_003023 [Pomphorhynchus laevis]